MAHQDYEITENNTESDQLPTRPFIPYVDDVYIEVGPENYYFPNTYKMWAQKLNSLKMRTDDVLVSGFPRTGTTWTQEMVWMINNDLNFEEAKKPASDRVPLLEMDILITNKMDVLTYFDGMKSPRCVKTHLPWSLLPEELTNGSKQPKIIHVLRNPKDVCVSFYHSQRSYHAYKGRFEDFCLLFLEGRVLAGPFWKSILSYWKERHRSNILFIRYKDMKENLRSVIIEVATFLGKQLTEMQTQQLLDHLKIETMRNNPAVNYGEELETFVKPFKLMVSEKTTFIGKGEQNTYLSMMSSELIEKFDEWSKRNLEGTDLVVE